MFQQLSKPIKSLLGRELLAFQRQQCLNFRNTQHRLERTNKKKMRNMPRRIALAQGRGEQLLFHIVIDHGGSEKVFAVRGKNAEGLVDDSQHLIHIQLQRGKLAVAGKMKLQYFLTGGGSLKIGAHNAALLA